MAITEVKLLQFLFKQKKVKHHSRKRK